LYSRGLGGPAAHLGQQVQLFSVDHGLSIRYREILMKSRRSDSLGEI